MHRGNRHSAARLQEGAEEEEEEGGERGMYSKLTQRSDGEEAGVAGLHVRCADAFNARHRVCAFCSRMYG